MKYIMSIENGNIFPCCAGGMQAAYAEAQELYDIDDDTNCMTFWDYYTIVES